MKKIIIIGAGAAGRYLADEIKNLRSSYEFVVGFCDDFIKNNEVLGTIESIPNIVKKHKIDLIYIAIPSATKDEMRRIISLCRETKISFKTLPRLSSFLECKVELTQLRQVEIDDLLGRDPVVQSIF